MLNQSATYPSGLSAPFLIGHPPSLGFLVLPHYLWKITRSLILKISSEHRWTGDGEKAYWDWNGLVKMTPGTGVESYRYKHFFF